MKNNEQGRSMIEMLGVLSIVGVLSISGIILFSKAIHQRKVSTTIEQISEIISNMRNSYRNRKEYDFSLPASQAADKRKIIPENMWVDGNIQTALGQGIQDIRNCKNKTNDVCDETKEFLLIVVNDITGKDSSNACVRILTANWGNNIKVCGNYQESESCNCESVANCSKILPLDKASEYCSRFSEFGFYVK